MRNLNKHFSLIFVTLLFVFCNSISAQNDTTEYLFLGHTYQYYTAGNRVDYRIENMDLSGYDGIWLGGDICSESLLDYSTLAYIDSTFDLQHPNSHWALGNHDARNGNWTWLEELTGKKTYYTSHYKGITYIVLNTNITPYDCEQLDDQYRTIVNVCDTIKESSHLVMLVHQGIWEGVPGIPPPSTYAQSILRYYNFNCYSNESSFVNEIYPRLTKVKERGVEVICLIGDMGNKKLEAVSDHGIHFLGCGLNKSIYKDIEDRKKANSDYALIFKHIPKERKLEWEFHDFDVLSGFEY